MNIYPSLISAPLLYLGDTIKKLEPYCQGFHLDIMDFHFVPNLTWGPAFINAIREATHKQLWIHLMVDAPILYLNTFKLHKNDIISLHYESVPQAELIQLFILIKEQGFKPSLAIDPTTLISDTVPLFPYIDHYLLMSVTPGFSGQPFITATYERLAELQELRTYHQASFHIALDGGLTPEIIKNVMPFGVQYFALAQAIFGKGKNSIDILKNL